MWPTRLLPRLAASHQPPRKAPPRRRPAFRRPLLEALEGRCLLSFTPGPLVEVSNPDPLADCPPGTLGADVAAEPYVAVNPTNPNNIAAIWIDHGNAGLVAGVTLDGGRSWQNVAIPGITLCTGGPWQRGWDPWLSFAPNGDLYSIGKGKDASKEGQIFVNKSTDGGRTWSSPIPLYTPDNSNSVFDDKPSLTADPFNPNDVYATWARFKNFPAGNGAQTMFARSTDGGRTWQPAQDIHDASPGTDFDWGHQVVVLPGGTLIDAFVEGAYNGNQQAALTLLRSTDHGQTWSAPIRAVVQEPLVDPNSNPPNAILTDPNTGQAVEAHPMFDSLAVDPKSGNLYAVWIDARFSNSQHNSIALSMSSDGGLTWSAPIQANQTPTNVPSADQQAWNPTVAVAADGTVAVTYYDFRNNTGASGTLTDYWLAYCRPSASTPATDPANWGEVRLTSTSFNLEQAPGRFGGDFFLGDYEGLAAAGNNFAAVWGMPDGAAAGQESIFFRTALSNKAQAPAAVAAPAQLAAGTLATSTTSPPSASSSTSPAPLLASPAPDSSLDPAAVSVALSLSQRPETQDVTAASVMSFVQAPLLAPSLTSNLPPPGHDTDSSEAVGTSLSAADRVFAGLDGPQPFQWLGEDLALAGWGSDDLMPTAARG
jgi:hypothetical protein